MVSRNLICIQSIHWCNLLRGYDYMVPTSPYYGEQVLRCISLLQTRATFLWAWGVYAILLQRRCGTKGWIQPYRYLRHTVYENQSFVKHPKYAWIASLLVITIPVLLFIADFGRSFLWTGFNCELLYSYFDRYISDISRKKLEFLRDS